MRREIFITGGTGYVGRSLIPELIRRGHSVRALVRRGSESRVPVGCVALPGDPLDASTFATAFGRSETFVQLVGVAHPSPSKADQFKAVDLVSVRESVMVAVAAGIRHFVYVSVAQPSPVMKAYQEVRAEGERLIRASGMPATILRPWYVLGPGHRWPCLLAPLYWLAERIPSRRSTAQRLGLVTLGQMASTLVAAVEAPPEGVRIVEVPEIRSGFHAGVPRHEAAFAC